MTLTDKIPFPNLLKQMQEYKPHETVFMGFETNCRYNLQVEMWLTFKGKYFVEFGSRSRTMWVSFDKKTSYPKMKVYIDNRRFKYEIIIDGVVHSCDSIPSAYKLFKTKNP